MNKKYLLLSLLSLLFIINNVLGETVIYDNITSYQYKVIKIDDIMNIPIFDYKYEVYIDNQFIGYYSKNENIFVPNNSDVLIYIPSPIKTDITDIYHSYVLPNLYLIVGFLLTFGLVCIIIFYIIYRVWRNRK